MKFNELCDYVLTEAHYDTLTGERKQFTLAPNAMDKISTLSVDDIGEIVKKVAGKVKGVGLTPDIISKFIVDINDKQNIDFEETGMLTYLTDMGIKGVIDRAMREYYKLPVPEDASYDEGKTPPGDRVAKAVDTIFTWMKKNDYITSVSQAEMSKQKKELEAKRAQDESESLDRLSDIFASDVADDEESEGMGWGDVEKFGGSVEKSRHHAEDESQWY